MKTKLLLSVFLLSISTFLSAQIINVPATQPTIQAGIDVASTGDTVLVDTGTYFENISFNGKAITVASNFIMDGDTSHINNTIIDGSQPFNPDSASTVMLISGEDTTSTICGFTITGGTGLDLPLPFGGSMGGGIACYHAGAKITDNKIINNTVSNTSYPNGGGIGFISGNRSGWIVIRDNNIVNNTVVADEEETFGGGIYIMGNALVESNVIESNYCHLLSSTGEIMGGGLYAESSTSNPLDTLIVNNNIIKNNILEGGDYTRGGGIACGDFFPCPISFITNNTINNNTILSESVGWGSGIYLTEIQGKISISGNVLHLNSATTGSACGTVIHINQPQRNVNILNNLISNNWASGNDWTWAAGIWLWDAENVQVVVDGNIIKNNTGKRAGGFYARNSYNYQLTNNVFSGNNVDVTGGAVQLHQYYGARDPLVKTGSMHPVIANNTFTNNTAGEDGGAIYITSYYDSLCPVIFNNIFWENQALTGTGNDIYYGGDENLHLENNNIDTELIVGNWEGQGNIFEDPLFIDSQNGDFHINVNSPCAAAGIDSLDVNGIMYYCPLFDFEGDSRPMPSTYMPDIGADEVDEETGLFTFKKRDDISLITYPNPFTASTTIVYELLKPGNINISLFNNLGQQIESINQENSKLGKQQFVWDATSLPNGIYFVQVRAGQEVATKKIIKMR